MIPEKFLIPGLKEVLQKKELPVIKMWNRLEARPRTHHFDKALRAEVRDALWMLTRQWQMGEFTGDDAGAPVLAKAWIETAGLTHFTPGHHSTKAFDPTLPLEAQVEQRSIPAHCQGQPIAYEIRMQMGRQWLKMLSAEGQGGLKSAFIEKYGFETPPETSGTAVVHANTETLQYLAAISGRCMDGMKLFFYLTSNTLHKASDGIAGAGDPVDSLAPGWISWFKELYQQPDEKDASWNAQALEYHCSVDAPQTVTNNKLVAEEYYHGHMDWYNFDLSAETAMPDPALGVPVTNNHVRSFIPSGISFPGMPNPRWWMFEDGKTSFGNIQPNKTDLARLLLMEFGLVYANDWFLLPFSLPVGSVCRVRGLMITNTFGETTWLRPAGFGLDDQWERWAMFNLSRRNNFWWQPSDDALLVLPVATGSQQGPVLEEVYLVRDEMANMVWGIETAATLPHGQTIPGKEAALQTTAYFEKLFPKPPALVPKAPREENTVEYQAMTAVPENWIPFIPRKADVQGNTREIMLQRAAMLRYIPHAPDPADRNLKIEPRNSLIRTGLDEKESKPYYVNEEEVPRSGVRITSRFQRVRWFNGRPVVWLGITKSTGKGEGSSGLAFDQAVPVK